MYLKDINKLKKQMNKRCNLIISNIIDQMIANEQYMKVDAKDPDAVLEAFKFKTDIRLFVKPPAQAEYEIGNISAIDLK